MKNNSESGFIVPTLIGVIVLLIIGGGVYVYMNKKSEALIVPTNQVDQIDTAQINNNASVKTVNLKIYKNAADKYTLSIPTEWMYKGPNSTNQFDTANFFGLNSADFVPESDGYAPSISPFRVFASENTTVKDAVAMWANEGEFSQGTFLGMEAHVSKKEDLKIGDY